MVNGDTIELLKECNAGVKMGVSSIEDLIDKADDKKLKSILQDSLDEHKRLGDETREILNDYDDEGKEPNPMAKGMSWLKTNMMMSVNHSDETIADLIFEGCSMGVKSLSRYLNKYEAAEEKTKDIAKKLISMEDRLATEMRAYL
ncbi:MAG: hypothetical protein J6R68_02640 [Clostridia bacterium]|nr:hypothetical protein [Clostridia bacterium]MBO7289033.1 hypothetical protein [Clostridia bacterium]